MTDESQSCPAEEVLLDFVAERLDESTRQQVQDHLGVCDNCAESVEWMTRNLLREVTDELGEASQATEGLASKESVEEDTEAWCGVGDDEFDVRQFSPSPNKNAMGRLGKYDILGVLGRGGMGVVFRAFDEQLRRTVAIKVLNRRLSNSDTARRRFIREARAAAGINHHNVVTIHAVEEHEHCPFLVMEFVDGGSLREHIRRNRRLDPLEVVRLSKEIAAGLAAAHAQGVIHRDIKPGNIMLEDGAVRVKIGDFGLARVAVDNVDLTSRELAVGTPTYMSPEQVKGNKVDLRSDLFSLGCVMYAMIAGQSPFRGQHALEVAHKVADVTPAPLAKTIEGTPETLSDMVAKLLKKEPGDRYQSATEVAEVLGRYLAILNETPTDEMSAVLQGRRPQREPEREPTARWALITCALVLVAGLVSLPFLWPGKETPGPAADSSNRTQGRGGAGASSEDPELVTVGQSVDADVQSINRALATAGPGTVIRVIDNGTYSEAIEFTNASRQRGIVLESNWESDPTQRPTLTVPDETAPVIRIQDVPGVVIRGFRIEPYKQPAISVGGTAAGTVIESIECFQIRAEINEPGVLVRATRGTPDDPAIVIRQSRFHNPFTNQRIRVVGLPPMGQHVRIEENTFSGRDVLILLGARDAPLGETVVAGNVFLGREDGESTTGINVNLTEGGVESNICIHNNTFLNTTNWIGLAFTRDYQPGVTIANNLILGSVAFAGPYEEIEKAAEVWQFEANCWEKGPETFDDAGHHGLIATLEDKIELQNRDDDKHEDFLRPPPDSPLLTSGYGKEGLPAHIGAVGPKKPGTGETE